MVSRPARRISKKRLRSNGWLVRLLADRLSRMSRPLTANDLLPLVARLAPRERERLARLIAATSERDAALYLSAPPRQDEFASDDESLGWDAEGWEELK